MTEQVWKDHIPANARIVVTYGKENTVDFSYPKEWSWNQAVWKRGFFVIMNAIYAIPFKVLMNIAPLFGIPAVYFLYRLIFNPWTETTTQVFDIWMLLPIGLVLFVVIGIPVVINFVLSLNRQRYCELIPKLASWSARIIGEYCSYGFLSRDVTAYGDEWACSIPIFGNVFLEYSASGEFNDHLKRVEIMELPYEYNQSPIVWWLPKPKRHRTDMEWRAMFVFDKKPNDGALLTEFR